MTFVTQKIAANMDEIYYCYVCMSLYVSKLLIQKEIHCTFAFFLEYDKLFI